MNCQQCRKWWSPYLDSELDASTTFEVSEHLRTCPACRERFEREARVENLLRERLRRGKMPDEAWSRICSEVRAEPRSRRFPPVRVFALAASVAMLITAGALIYSNLERSPQGGGNTAAVPVGQSMSDLLQDRAPTLVAFTDAPEADFNRHLENLSRQYLNAVVTIDPAHGDGHTFQLLEVSEREDHKGVPYVEVRLNCCGRPVLLALAPAGCSSCIQELRNVTGNCKHKSRRGCPKSPPIEAQSVDRDGVMIAAATADHYLTGVLSAISVRPL
ncbi:MAG TPA: zf-HC2 domain-containing protein [Phycisphaerae bacterium]|nr:zf-HC2 domain-containing protein [Phycisphaerales bacterium]HRX85428.1 zf-HC2 domain-containing protein [Phycisphaerae bacterium]